MLIYCTPIRVKREKDSEWETMVLVSDSPDGDGSTGRSILLDSKMQPCFFNGQIPWDIGSPMAWNGMGILNVDDWKP